MKNRFAFVFPGQGSQHLGMLKELFDQFPLVSDTFSQASDCLGYDLWALTQEGPLETLNQTKYTQPVLLVAGVALWRIWKHLQAPNPVYFAGHSLGEYTALVCANSLDFEEAVRLVADRGKYMQDAAPEGKGAMAAIIGLDENVVEELCVESSDVSHVVTPANYNSIGQIVVAGHNAAVEKAILHAKEKGAKLAMKLPVSVPSHCALMKPAADRLAQRFQNITFNSPQIPVINNVDVAYYQTSSQIADALVRQLYNPVRWIETIQFFESQGVDTIIESGPGKVLTGLNKRIAEKIAGIAITQMATLQQALKQVGVSEWNLMEKSF